MKNGDYITILSPMVSKLKLSGNNLLVFALIHGFSKDGENCLHGSLKYISKRTGICKNSVISILKKLCDIGYITKEEEYKNGIKFCKYKSNYYEIIYNKKIFCYKKQLKSKEWKNFRKKVFKIKGKKCEICGSTKQLNIHHPFYTKGKLAWQYNPSDMMVLCHDCHKEIHNIK